MSEREMERECVRERGGAQGEVCGFFFYTIDILTFPFSCCTGDGVRAHTMAKAGSQPAAEWGHCWWHRLIQSRGPGSIVPADWRMRMEFAGGCQKVSSPPPLFTTPTERGPLCAPPPRPPALRICTQVLPQKPESERLRRDVHPRPGLSTVLEQLTTPRQKNPSAIVTFLTYTGTEGKSYLPKTLAFKTMPSV